MKIYFEEWLNQQRISGQKKALLDESVLCYRSSAHRSTLLFSFLAFPTFLKERLLDVDKPGECSKSLWEDIQAKLLNDNTWEAKVIAVV